MNDPHFTLDVDPAAIRHVGTWLTQLSEVLDESGHRVAGMPGVIGDRWQGNAAEVVKGEMTGLGGLMTGTYPTRLTELAGEAEKLATVYETALETVVGLNTRWTNAEDDVQHAVDVVNRLERHQLEGDEVDPDVLEAKRRDLVHAQGLRNRAHSQLTTAFTELREELATATARFGRALSASAPVEVPAETVANFNRSGYSPELRVEGAALDVLGLTRDHQRMLAGDLTSAEVEELLRNAVDEEGFPDPVLQAEIIKRHLDAVHRSMLGVLDEEVAIILAREVGAAIKTPEMIDEQIVALLGLFAEDPAFAEALYNPHDGGVRIPQMADAVSHLDGQVSWIDDPSGDSAAAVVYRGFLDAAGVATATRATDLDAGLPGLAEEWARQWAEAIKDPAAPHNASALTLLLRKGGEAGASYPPSFLTTLADEIYQWDRDDPNGRIWADRAGYGVMDPDSVRVGEWDQQGMRLEGVLTGGKAGDGLANLLGAMAHSPEAAQAFFTTSGDTGLRGLLGDDELGLRVVDRDKLGYLLTERGWHDTIRFGSAGWSDDGAGLGAALQAASLPQAGNAGEGFDDRVAARVASGVITVVGQNAGNLTYPDPGQLDGRYLPPGLVEPLAGIAAGYADDLYHLLQSESAVKEDLLDYRVGPHLNITEGDLDGFLAEIGRGPDQGGVEIVTAAMLAEGNRIFGELLDGDGAGGDPYDGAMPYGMAMVAASNAEIIGKILEASHGLRPDPSLEENPSIWEDRSEMVAKAVEVAAVYIPKDPRSTTVNLLVSEGVKALTNAIREHDTTPDTADSSKWDIDDIVKQMEDGLMTQLETRDHEPTDKEHGWAFDGWRRNMRDKLADGLGENRG